MNRNEVTARISKRELSFTSVSKILASPGKETKVRSRIKEIMIFFSFRHFHLMSALGRKRLFLLRGKVFDKSIREKENEQFEEGGMNSLFDNGPAESSLVFVKPCKE